MTPWRSRWRRTPEMVEWSGGALLVLFLATLPLAAARNRQEQPPAHRAVPVGVAELASLNWTADLPAGDSSAAE